MREVFDGACCPGKTITRLIMVGGQQVGIAFLDQIIEKALASEGTTEEELRAILLRELKVFNYVPSSAEDEYLHGIWEEFAKERSRRSERG